MMGGVTRYMLPHLPVFPHLHVNRPLIAGGRIGDIKGMSPGYTTLFPPQTTSFLLFLTMRSLVPGYE